MDLTLVFLATLTGMLTGAVFNVAGVPIPAPPNFAGVMGVVGVFLGYRVVEWASVAFF